ncbi:MAG: hypothetical protein ACXIVF_18730 [Rhizobiaceae bacterium]
MDRIQKVATFCTARLVFIAGVGIYIVMMFFSSDPAFAFKAGAILTLIVAGALVWKAGFVSRQEPSSTEVWLYLDNATRPRSEKAKRDFAEKLRQVYGRFSLHALAIACMMFVISSGLLDAIEDPAGQLLMAGAY